MTEVDPKSTLDELSTSLTSLEQVLASLVAKPFDELTQDLEPIEKARLQVMSGYIVHDLIWSQSTRLAFELTSLSLFFTGPLTKCLS